MELAAVVVKKEPQRLRHTKRALIAIERMQSSGLSAGDIVRLTNNGTTAFATAWPSFVSEPDEVQLTATMLLNCNARVGDILRIDRVDTMPTARQVSVTLNTEFSTRAFAEACVKESLVDVGCAYVGQRVDVSVNGIPRRLTVVKIELEDGTEPDISVGALVSRAKTHVDLLKHAHGLDPKSIRDGSTSSVSYASIGGLDNELRQVRRIVEGALSSSQEFKNFGLQAPRGVLLCGPPGTGKTLLARAVAAESGATVHVINGSEVTTKFIGEAEARLREIFADATKQAPSIVFIDEIDALCPRRSGTGNEATVRIVATLLASMDGVVDRGRVVVIGATNRPDSIDPALRRPGRFDREIEVPVPSPESRLRILETKLATTPNTITPEQLQGLAAVTHGFVGADLEALVREAAVLAIKEFGDRDVSELHISNDNMRAALSMVRPSCMREAALEIPQVRWEDIGGQHETKQLLREAVEWPLLHPEAFQRMGIRPPKGVLLYGPPGCSKTLTAKALATEAGLNFIAVRGPELFSKWVGESEKAVRAVFRKARAAAPAIVFFDEIDALTIKRGASGSSTSVGDRVLAQLLTEMDGIEPFVNVIVVAATNRPDVIDPGILRPDRIDRLVYVGPPDLETRGEILRIQLRKTACADDVDIEILADRTDGFSGAEVVALCQDAAIEAISEDPDAECVYMRHFEMCLRGFKKRITPEMIEFYTNFRNRTELLNKLIAVPVEEKLLRATGAGQVVGRLRSYEDASIGALAKKVVQKWKKDVIASNARASQTSAASTTGTATPASGKSANGGSSSVAGTKKPAPAGAKNGSSAAQSSASTSRNATPSRASTPAAASTAATSAAAPAALAAALAAPAGATNGSSVKAESPTQRTAASDNASLPKTGDPVRDKCIELLYNSMAADSDADSELLSNIAGGIEAIELGKTKSVTATYRARIRSLCLNLRDKNNPDLRNGVISGSISVERFCSMTSEEMASKELKETINKMKKENLSNAKAPVAEVAITDQFRCGNCKSRRCSYYQMQTRSADEPMTTFVTCEVCNHKWRFS
ncbi:AAA+-type ATPase [Coemansia interrupta]|uniref:AAA+-type ATPase n=1 Tax=Coemansia interrupta TaxID=1126814 RepID=A0A9W8LP61_9FUNG|nr:AAA+-type ATPase [Coemansia interrupta]